MCEKLASLFDIASTSRIFLLVYAALNGSSWICDEREESNKSEVSGNGEVRKKESKRKKGGS